MRSSKLLHVSESCVLPCQLSRDGLRLCDYCLTLENSQSLVILKPKSKYIYQIIFTHEPVYRLTAKFIFGCSPPNFLMFHAVAIRLLETCHLFMQVLHLQKGYTYLLSIQSCRKSHNMHTHSCTGHRAALSTFEKGKLILVTFVLMPFYSLHFCKF